MLLVSTEQKQTMHMAGIKKLKPQITEKNVCFQVKNTAKYTYSS